VKNAANRLDLFVDLQFADYGAAAKVKQMESHLNLLNFAKPLTGMDIASGGGTSFHLQPKVAATDSHKRLSFVGSGSFRTEIGDASESSGVPRRASRLSSLSGKSSLASGRFNCIAEELSAENGSSALTTSSHKDGLSL
jgi:hypothetical protein